MPQNETTGSAGDRYGREFGKRIAAALGAKKLSAASNECDLHGERVVIHCARSKTTSVGVTRRMVDTLSAVIGAFEQDDGSYRVFKLPMQSYREYMRPTASRGRSKGRVFLVSRSVFEEHGKPIGVFQV